MMRSAFAAMGLLVITAGVPACDPEDVCIGECGEPTSTTGPSNPTDPEPSSTGAPPTAPPTASPATPAADTGSSTGDPATTGTTGGSSTLGESGSETGSSHGSDSGSDGGSDDSNSGADGR